MKSRRGGLVARVTVLMILAGFCSTVKSSDELVARRRATPTEKPEDDEREKPTESAEIKRRGT